MNSANHELPSGRSKPAYYLESTFKSVPERKLPTAGSNLTWRLVKLSAARQQTHRRRKSRNLERPGSVQTELEIRAALQCFVTKSSLDFNSWPLATPVNKHGLHDPVQEYGKSPPKLSLILKKFFFPPNFTVWSSQNWTTSIAVGDKVRDKGYYTIISKTYPDLCNL